MKILFFSLILFVVVLINLLFIKVSKNKKYLQLIPVMFLLVADLVFLLRFFFFRSGYSVILDVVMMMVLTTSLVISLITLLIYKSCMKKD